MPENRSRSFIILLFKQHKKYLFALVAVIYSITALAGTDTASNKTPLPDSTKKDFISRAKAIGDKATQKSIALFNIEKLAIRQEELIDAIKIETFKARVFIRSGIDTTGIDDELEQVNTWVKIAGDGVFIKKGTAQTFRNLTTTNNMLREMLNRSKIRKEIIDDYEKDLVRFRYKIDSLTADTSLYKFPKDSLRIRDYIKRIGIVAAEINPADTALTYAINNIHKLQNKVDLVTNTLNAELEEIQNYQQDLASNTFSREFADLGDDVGYARPFGQIFYFSYLKAKLNFLFYSRNYPGRIFLIFLCIGVAVIFLRSLKQIAHQENDLFDKLPGQLILHYPWLSAIIIVLNLGQFIFPEPPFIFNCLFWVISSLCLIIIFRGFVTRYWMGVWLAYLVLFFLACLDNLVLQASRTERWGMLALASAGVILGLLVLIKGKREELREKLILYFIGLATLLELVSVFADIFGRYNLSKTLLTSGYLNVVIGILFLWTIRLINQGLYIASQVYTKQDKKLFYINFELVGEKAPALFYFLMIVGWFVLFGRNFYVFRFVANPLKAFFFNERTIGDYTFTVNNILIFFLIIAVSVVISKVVSYFASDKGAEHLTNGKVKKVGVGSWLLLIRVAIMGIGLFLAFAASGFPVQQITVIVGALGLGIGLGLQALVNNLVSGLIIAFEKPVNVGDIVEIGGQGGTMKSIGFRSSTISKWDGPDMVIPNGDLLNAHLINWTMAGSKRQMELVVGVAYGTDLQNTQKIITDLLAENKRIHEHPSPAVLFTNFNTSSIDVKVVFWVRDYKDGSSVKSEIIAGIDTAFKANGIVIPFPQQEVHLLTNEEKKDDTKDNESKKAAIIKPKDY